jgi:hypothetical protein
MAIFDLDKSISIEFHAEDAIERKMLGLWGQPEFAKWNIGMCLVNEQVQISVRDRVVTKIPFTLFDKLSVKELAEIITREATRKFNQ